MDTTYKKSLKSKIKYGERSYIYNLLRGLYKDTDDSQQTPILDFIEGGLPILILGDGRVWSLDDFIIRPHPFQSNFGYYLSFIFICPGKGYWRSCIKVYSDGPDGKITIPDCKMNFFLSVSKKDISSRPMAIYKQLIIEREL